MTTVRRLVSIALVVPAAVATDDPNVQATVGFGQWQTDPPLDRFTNPNDRTRNEHVLISREVKIKAKFEINTKPTRPPMRVRVKSGAAVGPVELTIPSFLPD